MSIAFFDFDGTIIKEDSLLLFLLFYFSPIQLFYKSILFTPYFVMYIFGIINNSKAKERLFEVFFKGENLEFFNNKCVIFANKVLSQKIKVEAINRIKWHQDQGDKVVVISASIRNYLEPLYQKENIKVIATELEINKEKLTGLFASPNCYGKEKVTRIVSEHNISSYKEVYAYGNSKGDNDLLALATKPFYKTFS